MKVAWIYRLPKHEIERILAANELTSTGSLSEIRARLVKFARKNEQQFAQPEHEMENLDRENEQSPTEMVSTLRRTPQSEPQDTSDTQAFDRMRKWNCQFNGKNAYDFLERIEEFQAMYRLNEEHLLRGIPQLLQGSAQLWYRGLRELHSWAEFKEELCKFYLADQGRDQLTEKIDDRIQRPNEDFRTYALEITTLIRRHGGYSTADTLRKVYKNMDPEVRLHIPIWSVQNITDLASKVSEHELTLEAVRKKRALQKPSRGVSSTTAAYDRTQCCWRCKQRGHRRDQCKNSPKLFCSVCGKDDIQTKDCHGTGNEPRIARAGQQGRSREGPTTGHIRRRPSEQENSRPL